MKTIICLTTVELLTLIVWIYYNTTMPTYELSLLLKKMANPQTATVLKRTALQIMQNNGILFQIENLGTRSLPYRIKSHGTRHLEGSYFIMRFDCTPTALLTLEDEYRRDIDIIRLGFIAVKPLEKEECTLEEEMKPPAYRKDVQDLIEEGRRRERVFDMKTGLSYNPWKR